MRAATALTLLLLLPALSGCLQEKVEGLQSSEPTHPLERSTFSWKPYFPQPGEPVTFHATVRSSVPGDEILGLKWVVDGALSTQNVPTHTFRAPGFYDVQLTVQTREGGRYALNDTVEVLSPTGTTGGGGGSGGSGGSGGGSGTGGSGQTPDTPVAEPEVLWEADANTYAFAFRFDDAAQSVHWDFGDGTESTEERPTHTYGATGDYDVVLRVLAPSGVYESTATVTVDEVPFLPHVIVAVPDTGINPYHELYRRPGLTAHPCTYIQDFPCDVPALNLTLDAPDWQTAYRADEDLWKSIKPGDWYWIPGTVFVAVHCDSAYLPEDGDVCILDDSHMHGTGTTSSVLMENPDALIAFKEYDPDVTTFQKRGIPVDVYSVSWGPSYAGVIGGAYPFPAGLCSWDVPEDVLYVKSSGNEPGLTVLADCWSGHPDIISVGGAYAEDDTQEPLAFKDMDVVSYFCRPTAQTRTITGMRESYCGTSFAAPTVAGALSKVVLGLRRASGYTGTVEKGVVDPILGVTVDDVRDAMEITASYDPEPEYDNDCLSCIPLNPVAPWTQWGWGFYDGTVADATLKHLLGDAQPDKSVEARLYLEAQQLVRETLYG